MQLHCPICHYQLIVTRSARTCGSRECMDTWRKTPPTARIAIVQEARELDQKTNKFTWHRSPSNALIP